MTRLPRHPLQGPDWPFYFNTTCVYLAPLAIAAIIAIVAAATATFAFWPTAVAQGVQRGVAVGTELTRSEVRAACGCWFNDSRCNHPTAPIACKQLDWMKE